MNRNRFSFGTEAGNAQYDTDITRCDCRELMCKLQTIDFSIIETVLYLDSYPDSREALEMYNQLICRREKIKNAYEAKCGPVTYMGNEKRCEWDWVQSPWPWEPGFPGKAGR